MKPKTERAEVNLEIRKSGRREEWEIFRRSDEKTWRSALPEQANLSQSFPYFLSS
jgi:hypothetical protein